MKIKGKKISSIHRETVVFPREEGDLVFVVSAVIDSTEFEKLCPEPEPPMIMKPGGEQIPDLKDTKYTDALIRRSKLQTSWLLLKSLEATDGLEFEMIDKTNPDTWEKIEDELKDAGLSNIERMQLLQAIMRVNSLDSRYLEEAKKRFFDLKQAQTGQ
jgi:hypothetical protein